MKSLYWLIGLVAVLLVISTVTCVPDNGIRPYLLWADRSHIRSLQIDTLLEQIVFGNMSNVIAIDFDYHDGYLFWTDVISNQLFRARKIVNGPAVDEMVIVSEIKTPEGIAVDWLYNHVYWVNSAADQIEVATYDGKMRRILVTEGLDAPRAIVVDPLHGWMFWTDWGKKPMISRCGLNGKHQSVIVDEGLAWPNGLTLGPNRCGTNNGRCGEFCFPSPQGGGVPDDSDKTNGFTCGCRNLYRLDSDQKTCVSETAGNQCLVDQFYCGNNNNCIPSIWKYDGNKDCHETDADEAECDLCTYTCASEKFRCNDNVCIELGL